MKRGETIITTERDHPFAQLQSLAPMNEHDSPAVLARLHESGALTRPRRATWGVQAFVASLPSDRPQPPEASLVAAVLAEREESP